MLCLCCLIFSPDICMYVVVYVAVIYVFPVHFCSVSYFSSHQGIFRNFHIYIRWFCCLRYPAAYFSYSIYISPPYLSFFPFLCWHWRMWRITKFFRFFLLSFSFSLGNGRFLFLILLGALFIPCTTSISAIFHLVLWRCLFLFSFCINKYAMFVSLTPTTRKRNKKINDKNTLTTKADRIKIPVDSFFMLSLFVLSSFHFLLRFVHALTIFVYLISWFNFVFFILGRSLVFIQFPFLELAKLKWK